MVGSVVAGTDTVGTVGDCPNAVPIAVGAVDPQVGYTPCGT
jgi:hypothetical protein